MSIKWMCRSVTIGGTIVLLHWQQLPQLSVYQTVEENLLRLLAAVLLCWPLCALAALLQLACEEAAKRRAFRVQSETCPKVEQSTPSEASLHSITVRLTPETAAVVRHLVAAACYDMSGPDMDPRLRCRALRVLNMLPNNPVSADWLTQPDTAV